MERDSRETIGKVVLDYSRYPGEDFYCDGAIEDELLEIVKSTAPEKYSAVIREKKSWEVLYHLSVFWSDIGVIYVNFLYKFKKRKETYVLGCSFSIAAVQSFR